MKANIPCFAIMMLFANVLSPPAAHASSPPADSVRFYLPVDPEQLQSDEPRPAGKWAADLNVGDPRTLRLFYFLPNDRPYRTGVVDSMKAGILDLQTFFGVQMKAHGYGDTTFRIETDDQGDPVVHRVDGDYGDSHYSSRGYTEGEIARAYDNSANIALIVMDVSARSAHGRGTGSKGSGWAMIYGDWNWFAAAHELGHAFGLHHDFRDNEYIMSYGRADRSSAKLSACAAEFLFAHPYFNADVPLENESPPTVELVSSEYPFGSVATPVQLSVRDDDGLHQVILFVRPKNPFLGGTPEVKVCRGLSGETDAVVEFNFDGRLPSDNVGTAAEAHTTLSNTVRHPIYVVAVDTAGNRTSTASLTPFTLEAGHSQQHIATIDRPYYYHVDGLAFSPDGAILAIGASGRVELLDAATRETIATFRHSAYTIPAVTFSPDGTLLAAGSREGAIKVWSVPGEAEVSTLNGHSDRVASLDFSPDGSMLASGSLDSTVKVWNVATWATGATLEGHSDRINKVAFVPGGKLAAVSFSGTVRLWDVSTKSRISTIETDAKGAVAFSPDGALLASPSSWAVKLWDLSTGTQTGAVNDMRDYNRAYPVFSPDGTVLAVAAFGLVELWDVSKRELMASISGGPGGVRRLLFSPDGRMLIGNEASSNSTQIKFWDVSEWAPSITPVSQRTSQVRDAILGVVRLNDANVSNFSEITETHLDGITALYLNNKGITSLKHGDFDGLTSLEELRLYGNQLTSLPEDIFSGLASLETLRFGLNQLTTLPSGLLEGLTSLTDLRMIGNRLTTLPDSIFVGLTGLTRLAMGGNAADPLPIPISLEKTGEGRFKAVAPTGAPFEIVLPLDVSNGSLSGGASSITIPAGSIESASLTVTRTPGSKFAVTADVGTLPGLPGNHTGYALVKSSDLPIVTTAGNVPATAALTMTVGAGPGAALRGYNPHSHPEWNFGSLSSRTFVLSGVSYTVHRLLYSVAGKRLDFQTSPMLRGFELHLDSHQLESFSAFDYNMHRWVNVNLSWSAGQSVRIGVVEAMPVPPGRPTSLVATPRDKQVILAWKLPANADPTTLPVTEYEFRVSNDGGSTWEPDWEIIPESRSGQDNRTNYTVGENDRHGRFFSDGLVNGTTYTFEIRARGGDGPGAAARATGVPGGATTAATDFNGDGRTDFADFFLFADAYGGTDSRFDLDGSGTVDFADFFKFVDAFGS